MPHYGCSFSNASGQMRQTLSAQAAGAKLHGRYMTSATESLDLLRLNIQTGINREIDAVITKYLDKFFKPAVENIRNNLGENSVNEENIREVCRRILEDAKHQYYGANQSKINSQYRDLETGCFAAARTSPLAFYQPKRKESDSYSEASQAKKKYPKTNSNNGILPPVKPMKMDTARRRGPKWDPNRIHKSTLFIMGARANKVLGFGQTRGRLYTKHPELLKYSGDAEDKEWLSRHNLIPPTGGIAYLLILEDVRELAESDEYRHNPNVLLSDLKGFRAPEFMLKKIRAFAAQVRLNDKIASMRSNDTDEGAPNRYNHSGPCDSFMPFSPATVLAAPPGTPADCTELADYPNGQQMFFQSCNFASPKTNAFASEAVFSSGNIESGSSLHHPDSSASVHNTKNLSYNSFVDLC